MEIDYAAKEMGCPAYTPINMKGNEDILSRLPDITQMEESALFNE